MSHEEEQRRRAAMRAAAQHAQTAPQAVTPTPSTGAGATPAHREVRDAINTAIHEVRENAVVAHRGAAGNLHETIENVQTLTGAARGRTSDTDGLEAVRAAGGLASSASEAGEALGSERVRHVAGAAGDVLGAGAGVMQAQRGVNQWRSAHDTQGRATAVTTGASGIRATARSAESLLGRAAQVANHHEDVLPGAPPLPTNLARAGRAAGTIGRVADGAAGAATAVGGMAEIANAHGDDDALQQGVVHVGTGTVRTLGAIAGAPGRTVASVGTYGIEAAGDDAAGGRSGLMHDSRGRAVGGSRWAADRGAEVRESLRGDHPILAEVAGGATVLGSSVVGAGGNIAGHTREAADEAANTAMHHMGLEGESAQALARRAAAEERAAQARRRAREAEDRAAATRPPPPPIPLAHVPEVESTLADANLTPQQRFERDFLRSLPPERP